VGKENKDHLRRGLIKIKITYYSDNPAIILRNFNNR
jgi:hypothetical protein